MSVIAQVKPAHAVIPSEPGSNRRSPRYNLIDTAHFLERTEYGQSRARTSDISRHGCYLETMNPLPAGLFTRVRLSLGGRFEAVGVVVHSQPGMGMGLEWVKMDEASQAVLERWLEERSKKD